MSDNIPPFEIQVEIMKKLPVKSLIQFRSVSKLWKFIIDSSAFIADHTCQHTQQMQHLLFVRADSDLKYVLIADDDDIFHQHKVPLTVPLLGNLLKCPHIIGSSHGLFSWYTKGGSAVVWNPCIRKAVFVAVDMPNVDNLYGAVLGFGVCRETKDPKLVKIKHIKDEVDIESIDSIPTQVEVFTLSGGAWRSSYSNLPRKSIYFHTFHACQVVTDGFLYLLAADRDSASECNLIISFDLTSEEFGEVNLPHSLAYDFSNGLSLSKLRESLVVLRLHIEDDEDVFVVWMMEDGVPGSFTQLFTFYGNTKTRICEIMGFRKSGEPIIKIFEDEYKLVVYEAYSTHIVKLRIKAIGHAFYMYPYVETLLLHDQPNLKMFCLGN